MQACEMRVRACEGRVRGLVAIEQIISILTVAMFRFEVVPRLSVQYSAGIYPSEVE